MKTPPHRRRSRPASWLRLAAGLVVVAILVLSLWSKQRENAPEDRPTIAPRATTDGPQAVIRNQTIYDQGGDVVYRGDVDVGPTLARIAAGERLDFPNDGSTFQNRERRLPRQRAGYYKEYVHPTPDLPGPGPQRIVAGQEEEIYYTPDHYRTFRRLDEP